MDEEIIRRVKSYIAKVNQHFGGLKKVYIFGSYAKNNQTTHSDIDIAVIFDDFDESQQFDMQVKMLLLAADIDSRIEPHPILYKHLYTDNPFINEILRTGIAIDIN